jgi:hypothetical protein
MAQKKEGKFSSQLYIWMALILLPFDAETSTIQENYWDQELFGLLTS